MGLEIPYWRRTDPCSNIVSFSDQELYHLTFEVDCVDTLTETHTHTHLTHYCIWTTKVIGNNNVDVECKFVGCVSLFIVITVIIIK